MRLTPIFFMDSPRHSMRVLHFFKSDMMSGAEHIVFDIASNLKQDDAYDIGIICGGQTTKSYFEEAGIQSMIFEGRNPIALHRLVKLFKPDIIHAHDNSASFLMLLSFTGVPIISHVHNYYHYFEARNIYYWINRIFRRFFNYSIYCSEEVRNKIENAAPGLTQRNSIVMNNMVQVERVFTNAHEIRTNDTELTIGFAGRMTEQKGLEPFLEAVEAKKEAFDPNKVRIILVGKGTRDVMIEEKIKQYELEEFVIKEPFMKNPYPFIASLDLLILPSKWEGLPIIILEAALLETPVLSMDVGGVRQFITDGVTGYLCHQNQYDAFVEKMIEILGKDHSLIVKNAKSRVLEKYGSEPYIRQLKGLYQQIYKERKVDKK
jgi:glycosyltransferase involved in cell wall biosynthesis